MLTRAENELLTRTGPGTPCGELMRRYWQPAALSEEVPPGGAPIPIRLFSEDLVLFRDETGLSAAHEPDPTAYCRRSIPRALESTLLTPQQSRDREYRSTAPGFTLQLQGTDTSALVRFHSREIPLPENKFTGDNRARYSNPDLDALLDRYIVTIPQPERIQLLAQKLKHLSEQLIPLPLFYNSTPTSWRTGCRAQPQVDGRCTTGT